MIDKLSPLYARGIKPIPVIPTVYTDALSYGEQVGVMTHKIDECVDKVNEVVDDNNDFKTDLTEQQDTFETNITNQQSSFETAITNQQNTFETNITNQQNTYESTTTAGLNTWKTNTKAEYKAQIDGMEAEWDNFLEEYETIGDVTQNPYGENTLVVTSQKAVNDGLKGYNGIGNILFGTQPVYNKYFRAGQAPQSNNNYSYFDLTLNAGTYYSQSKMRFVSTTTTLIGEDLYTFTVAEDDTEIVVTFYNNEVWKLSTSDDFTKVCCFKSTSFSAEQLKQEYGEDNSVPISQNGIKRIFEQKNAFSINNNIGSGNHINLLYNAREIIFNRYYNGVAYNNDTNYSLVYIHLISGTTYYFHRPARFICTVGNNLGEDVESYTPVQTGEYIITMANNASIQTGGASSDMIITTTNDFENIPPYTCPEFVANNLMQTTGSNTKRPMSQKAVTDALNAIGTPTLQNKKWCVCGDSFTKGDFTGASNYTFTDEPYSGKNKVYAYFIGRRCQMNVVMLAEGGMTMGVRAGSTNNFSGSLYQSIPADSDYITFKFGINDEGYNVPIGNIDDATNETFYGAWNVVLSWVIANRPTAHLGIIVTNGLGSDTYADAIIAIAKRYGIPYINEWKGEQVPLMIRNGRTDVLESVRTARNELYRVSSTNTHPNVLAHEHESLFLEQWLKTL